MKSRHITLYILITLISISIYILYINTHSDGFVDTFKDEVVVVTAYYPVKNKHGQDKYMNWAKNFFRALENTKIICFTPPEMVEQLNNISGNANVEFVARPFYSFKMMSPEFMRKFQEGYKKEALTRPNESPELHAIWSAKHEFVNIAINDIYPHGHIYVWCDIGCFRNERAGNFQNTPQFVQPGKITILHINREDFKGFGGGVLAGDKTAWAWLSSRYLEELEYDFHGVDQAIFMRICTPSNATIIDATDELGDRWFYLTYIFHKPS